MGENPQGARYSAICPPGEKSIEDEGDSNYLKVSMDYPSMRYGQASMELISILGISLIVILVFSVLSSDFLTSIAVNRNYADAQDAVKRLANAADAVYAQGEGAVEIVQIKIPSNANLMRLLEPHLNRPVGRPPQSGIQVKIVDLHYQAKSWSRPRRVVAKIEWHRGELFPRIGFVITNSRLPAGKVIKVYNGRAEIENRIKEGKNTLRWDKTSCQRFEANQARLQMGVLAYNLLHMIRQFYVWGEEVKRSMEWLIKRLIKVGARISYHARRWHVHVASAFPLAHHYRAVLAWGS